MSVRIEVMVVGDFLVHDSDHQVAGVDSCQADQELAGFLTVDVWTGCCHLINVFIYYYLGLNRLPNNNLNHNKFIHHNIRIDLSIN